MDYYNFLIEHFGIVVTILIILIVGVIGITFSVKFDLNKYLEARKKTNRARAQHFCPHMDFEPTEDKNIIVNSWFESPPGTSQWICRACGITKNNINQDKQEKDAEYWIKNYEKYKKQLAKYNGYAKRSV